MPEHCRDQVSPLREVPVDGAHTHAGFLRNRAHRCIHTLLGEYIARRFHHRIDIAQRICPNAATRCIAHCCFTHFLVRQSGHLIR